MSRTSFNETELGTRLRYLLVSLSRMNYDRIFLRADNGEPIAFQEVFPLGRTVVVGNSPILMDQKNGAVIDSANTVVRFNDFQTAGYEENTGTKTSVWVTGAGVQSTGDIPVGVGTQRLFFTHKYMTFKEKQDKLVEKFGKDNIPMFLVFHDDFMLRTIKVTLQCTPTTGLVMLLLLATKYGGLEAYGFSFGMYKQQYHYFKDKVIQDFGHHWAKESQIFKFLLSKGFLRLGPPPPPSQAPAHKNQQKLTRPPPPRGQPPANYRTVRNVRMQTQRRYRGRPRQMAPQRPPPKVGPARPVGNYSLPTAAPNPLSQLSNANQPKRNIVEETNKNLDILLKLVMQDKSD